MIDRPSYRGATVTRRRFLRDAATLAAVGATAGCLDGTNLDPDGIGPDGSPDATGRVDERVRAYERATHRRVNDVRASHDLDPLAYSEGIAAVAREHSADMAERDYFAHQSPEGEGPGDRMGEFFPWHCRMVGENIARVGRRPDDGPEAVAERVVSGWMRSPGHRENLLREAFDEEGIGVTITGDRVLATQNLCATHGGVDWPRARDDAGHPRLHDSAARRP